MKWKAGSCSAIGLAPSFCLLSPSVVWSPSPVSLPSVSFPSFSSPYTSAVSLFSCTCHACEGSRKGWEKKKESAGPELEKIQGSRGREGRGGERKSKRPITPSEHLKLLAGLSSAAALISPPISANPTGLPWTRWTVKTHLFSLPLSLLLNFLHSFVPGLHSLSLH